MIINTVMQGEIESPAQPFIPRAVINGKLTYSNNSPFAGLPEGVTDVDSYIFYEAYQGTSAAMLNGNIDLSSLEKISGASALYRTFYNCTGITSIDLSSVESITGQGALGNMCYGCTGLTSLDLSSLQTVTGQQALRYMCFNCTALTTVDLDSLETVSGANSLNSTFSNCEALTDFKISSLTSITGNTALQNLCSGCINLTSVKFSSLKIVTGSGCLGSAFGAGNHAITLYFPALNSTSFGTQTNQISTLLYANTGSTIHFPKNLDPQSGSTTISSLSGYPNFDGTNTILMFDLPSTKILTGADTVQYERNPKYDTATALSWRVNGASVTTTAYYTSTTNDPSVGDTIYSDSACTTAVTTISSIA